MAQFKYSLKVTNPYNQPEVPNPPQDTISQLSWCPTKPILTASSWDCSVSAWVVNPPTGNDSNGPVSCKPIIRVHHKAPVLSVFCSEDGRIFSGGCDHIAKVTALPGVNLGRGGVSSLDFGSHNDCISTIHHVPKVNLIITGGWDRKLRYWDDRLKSGAHVFEFGLPERAYCADVKDNVYVVCCGGKNKDVGVFDLRSPKKVRKSERSSLRLQTKSCKVFPDCKGYVIGSIEGRVSVRYLNQERRSFAFKCHREGPGKRKMNCFAVNDISFHPILGTFATCGSNGRFNFWDLKKQIRVYNMQKKFSLPLTCGQFSPDGTLFALGVGYDFSQGTEVDVFKRGCGSKIVLQRSTRRMHR